MQATDISPRQLKVLSTVAQWRGPGLPLAGVLADQLGLAGEAAVRYQFKQLAARGYLELVDVHRRTYPKLTDKARQALGIVAPKHLQPIHVGQTAEAIPVYPIRCGSLVEANAEPRFLHSPSEMFRQWRTGDYLLVGEGDSMECVGDPDSISEGDWIQLRPDVFPGPGEIAHVSYLTDTGTHEATLKKFFLNEHTGVVTLRALNPAYEDIVLPGERVEVRGVVLETLQHKSPRSRATK